MASETTLTETSAMTSVMWPNDVAVLFRWPDVLDLFPSPDKDPAKSYNALSRLVLFGGLTLFYVRREPVVLASTAMLMYYLFGQQNKYNNTQSANEQNPSDAQKPAEIEENVAKERAMKIEAQVVAQRLVNNPREIRGRAAIVPTPDDVMFAHRPTKDWSVSTEEPEWMSGKVGVMKSVVKNH
jgi:hypothetical protein